MDVKDWWHDLVLRFWQFCYDVALEQDLECLVRFCQRRIEGYLR